MLTPREYCPKCDNVVDCRVTRVWSVTKWTCIYCGSLLDMEIEDDDEREQPTNDES